MGLPCNSFRSRADSFWIPKAHSIQNIGIILAPLPIDSLKLSVDEQKQKNKDQLSLGLKMKSTDSSNVQLKQALQK